VVEANFANCSKIPIMAFWDKFTGGSGGSEAAQFKPDPRKARRFFEYAQTTADAGNYDYSIECSINGLRHDPELMARHEALYEVAKRRKVKGGKPAGFAEKHKPLGPRPVDKMLLAEKIWAKDMLNISAMYEFMKAAVEADEAHEQINLTEVAYWIGSILLEAITQPKHQKLKLFLNIRDLFEQIEGYDKAIEACLRAISMNQGNTDLLQNLKELEASNAMQKGGYNRTDAEEGGFSKFVRDADKQLALEQEGTVAKTESVIDQIIARRRAEYEEDPQDMDRLTKLADALVQKEQRESEIEAIDLLQEAWEETGSYRYKVRAGDIKIKQMARVLRVLSAKLKQNPADDAIKQQRDQARRVKLKFELEEFTERVKNYPTDLSLKFDYGLRLYQSDQIDEAIGVLQQAKADPKRRSAAFFYLGHCYLRKDWLDETIDTLRDGLDKHAVKDDKQGLELQYLLMDVLEKAATNNRDAVMANEAREIASTILQADINFRDIRDRVDKIRALIEKLK